MTNETDPDIDADSDIGDSATLAVTSAPVTTDWRIMVATLAYKFFGVNRTKEWADLASAPYEDGKVLPWTAAHLHNLLQKAGWRLLAVKRRRAQVLLGDVMPS